MALKTSDKAYRDKIESAAALFGRTISVDAAEEDFMALTLWLEQDESHAEILMTVQNTAAEINAISGESAVLLLQNIQALEAAETTEASKAQSGIWPQIQTAFSGFFASIVPQKRSWQTPAFAATATIVAVGLWTVLPSFTQGSLHVEQYASQANDTKTVILADGSEIHLNQQTLIETSFDSKHRMVTLNSGEAIFNIAKDPDRPFIVNLGGSSVRVVGTVFNILKHEKRLELTVNEGIVDYNVIDPNSLETPVSDYTFKHRLTAGKQLRAYKDPEEFSVRDVDAENIFAWRTGQLIYDETELRHIGADINRYFQIEVILEEDLSHQLFSGALNTNDLGSIISLLQESLPITIEKQVGRLIISPE